MTKMQPMSPITAMLGMVSPSLTIFAISLPHFCAATEGDFANAAPSSSYSLVLDNDSRGRLGRGASDSARRHRRPDPRSGGCLSFHGLQQTGASDPAER